VVCFPAFGQVGFWKWQFFFAFAKARKPDFTKTWSFSKGRKGSGFEGFAKAKNLWTTCEKMP
jgi:hypothetical protein